MGLMSRNKGKRAEREIVDLLQPVIDYAYGQCGQQPPRLQRNQLQSDGGGYDILGIDWLAIEVKHCEVFSLNNWWEQAVEQAGDRLPVLFYRRNQVPWRVRTRGGIGNVREYMQPCVVDTDTESFEWFLNNQIQKRLQPKGRK